MWHIHCIIFPKSAPEWSWILVKISHITMDFVISQASDGILLGLVLQLCMIWIWMRPTGVWMVSVDQDHAFPGQHLLQFGTKSGHLTVVSRVPCARILCCAVRLEGEDCSIIDPFSSIDSREVFLGFSIGLYSTTRRIHCKISPRWAPEWSFKFSSKLAISPRILLYPRPLMGFF